MAVDVHVGKIYLSLEGMWKELVAVDVHVGQSSSVNSGSISVVHGHIYVSALCWGFRGSVVPVVQVVNEHSSTNINEGICNFCNAKEWYSMERMLPIYKCSPVNVCCLLTS